MYSPKPNVSPCPSSHQCAGLLSVQLIPFYSGINTEEFHRYCNSPRICVIPFLVISDVPLRAAAHLGALLEHRVSVSFGSPRHRGSPLSISMPPIPAWLRADRSGRQRRTSHPTWLMQSCRGCSGELLCKQMSICLYSRCNCNALNSIF